MDSPLGRNIPDAQTITFPSGNQARLTMPGPGVSAASIITALGSPKPKALILVFGGAGGLGVNLGVKLRPLFTRGIARAAAKKAALIMDGGTDAGVMALMGMGVAAQREKPALLGVAPSEKVTYPADSRPETGSERVQLESNHSHFVLAYGDEFGDETASMFAIADEVAKDIPVVTLIVNGDKISKGEVLESVRRKWPVIVIKGSGRFADEICQCVKKKGQLKGASADDHELREIAEEGDLHFFAIDQPPKELELLILRLMQTHKDPSLIAAWQRFAEYDANAVYRQKRFNSFQFWILLLAVVTTLIVILQQQLFGTKIVEVSSDGTERTLPTHLFDRIFHITIIALPIIVSILVAASNRFKEGHKWILLRASAETIKQQIYRYRTGTNKYRSEPDAEKTPKEILAERIENISSKLMKTDVNVSSLRPYKGALPPRMYGAAAEDDGVGPMNPEQYIRVRLGDQLNFYSARTGKQEKSLKRVHWAIYIFGGLGTFLAAMGIELWVALTTSLAGVFGTFLEYKQVENTLIQYQQTATALNNVNDWWTALSESRKQDSNSFDQLVEQSENILQTEMMGWVQRMEDAQETLREQRAAEVAPPAAKQPADE